MSASLATARPRIGVNSLPMSRKRLRDGEARPDHEDTKVSKRTRVVPDEDRKLAVILDHLADEDADTRIKAAKDLLELLSNPPPELTEKAFKRLIRGLCSGRKAARYGFFVAFTELLRQKFPGGREPPDGDRIKLTEILPVISRLTQAGASSLGQVSCKMCPKLMPCLTMNRRNETITLAEFTH
jgi:DNA polymerase phi